MLAGALKCKDPCGLNLSLHTPVTCSAGRHTQICTQGCVQAHTRRGINMHCIYTHAHPDKGVWGRCRLPIRDLGFLGRLLLTSPFCDLGGSGLAAFLGIHNPSVSQPHTPLPIPSWATSFKALCISPEWTLPPFSSLSSLSQISLPVCRPETPSQKSHGWPWWASGCPRRQQVIH